MNEKLAYRLIPFVMVAISGAKQVAYNLVLYPTRSLECSCYLVEIRFAVLMPSETISCILFCCRRLSSDRDTVWFGCVLGMQPPPRPGSNFAYLLVFGGCTRVHR